MNYLASTGLGWLICAILLFLCAKVWRIRGVSMLISLTAAFFWLILDSLMKYGLFAIGADSFPTALTMLLSGLMAALIVAGMSKQNFKSCLAATYSVILLYWLILFLWWLILGSDQVEEGHWIQFLFGIPKP
jgi:hypothetical protein